MRNSFLKSLCVIELSPETITKEEIFLYRLPFHYEDGFKVLNIEAFKTWGENQVSCGDAYQVNDTTFLVHIIV